MQKLTHVPSLILILYKERSPLFYHQNHKKNNKKTTEMVHTMLTGERKTQKELLGQACWYGQYYFSIVSLKFIFEISFSDAVIIRSCV